MRRQSILALLFCLFSFSGISQAVDLDLKPKGPYSLKALQDLVKAQQVTVTEPHEQVSIRFDALPLKDLLDKVYGPSWRKEEEILFTCSDGYKPSLPVQKIVQHSPYIAFAAQDHPFSITNKLQNSEKVELGPYYLIWENQKDKDIALDGASVWPYQLIALEFVRFEDRFAAMAPPAGSKENVKHGFLAFRQYCQSCHRINGQGGDKSLELNYPMNVSEYWKEDLLKRWISDPLSIRWGTAMPPLNPTLKNREKVLDDLIAYLKAMKDKKIKPQ